MFNKIVVGAVVIYGIVELTQLAISVKDYVTYRILQRELDRMKNNWGLEIVYEQKES